MDKKPKRKDINKYVKPHTAHNWYGLGLELDVGDEDGDALSEIKEKFSNNKEDCFDKMMDKWLKETDPEQLTWRVLIDALKELKEDEAVAVIQKNLFAVDFTSPTVEVDDTLPLQSKQETQQCSASPTIATQTSVDTSPIPICSDSPAGLPKTDSQESSEETQTPTVATMEIDTSTDYPSSTECELFASLAPSYQLQLTPRSYQEELSQPGINGKNCIIVAPTGSGKTLVAAMIISEHLKKLQAADDIGKVVFLVNTKPLADQQCKVLQEYIQGVTVECIVGDSIGTIKNALNHNNIVVCTTGKFLEELNHDMVSLAFGGSTTTDSEKARISLLIMDECHHARKASAQAKVMHRYIMDMAEDKSALFPQVVGLTASPGAGDNPNLENTKTIDHLVNLCALLDATHGIVTVKENVSKLEEHVNSPVLNRELVPKRSDSEEFVQLVKGEMERLEKYVSLINPAVSKCSQQYESLVREQLLPLELSDNEKFRDNISTLKLLLCLSRALSIYMDLRRKDALKFLNDFTDLPDIDEVLTEHEKHLKSSVMALKEKLQAIKHVENPLLEKAKEVIYESFQDKSESRGVFFVRTKQHAFAVEEWICEMDESKSLKPIVITGHSRDTGMTEADQKVAMESFRSGENNILVATSVAEEGLDVPACNFVIRFQQVSNEIASTQTQGRARAKESEVTLILSSDSPMNMKEIQNTDRLELVQKIVLNDWIPTGKLLEKKIREQQKDTIRAIEFKKRFESERSHALLAQREVAVLKCKKCKEKVCSGSDIFTIGDSSHHVVPGDFIKQKLVKKPHEKPRRLSPTIIKTHKIHCKKCDADWGIMCNWPDEGHEFPVLKCMRFSFTVGDSFPRSVSQWSKAPFEVLPLDMWIEQHTE